MTSGNPVSGSTHAADQRRPDHVDRFAAPRIETIDGCRTHRTTPRDTGRDRAGRGPGSTERGNRAGVAGGRGRGAQVAALLVRGARAGVAGRCAPVWSAPDIHCRAGCPGQGDGLHATRRCGGAAGAVIVPGAGPPRRHRRGRTHDYLRHGITGITSRKVRRPGCGHRPGVRIGPPPPPRWEFKKFLAKLDKEIPAELDVHLICDNYATHKAPAVATWLDAHPRFHVHFTPTYASWLNQVERGMPRPSGTWPRAAVITERVGYETLLSANVRAGGPNPSPMPATNRIVGKPAVRRPPNVNLGCWRPTPAWFSASVR